MIPKKWLLPHETTEIEKELRALREENTRLKKAEPSFTIRCMDKLDSEVERYYSSYKRFERLTDEQIEVLMQRLKDYFPMETDFGSREPAESTVKPTRFKKRTGFNALIGTTKVFTPATNEEIAKYSDEAYPKWLKDCELSLRNHHRALQQQTPVLEFSFLATNVGTRPASDALITFEALGNFRIKPPPYDGKDRDVGNLLPTVLPQPPVPLAADGGG